MLVTMFLPTPNFTSASSSEKRVGHSATPRTPFSSQPYRKTNVWCPENLYVRSVTILAAPIRLSFVFFRVLFRRSGLNPLIDFGRLEFPQAAYLKRRHVAFPNPAMDRVGA